MALSCATTLTLTRFAKFSVNKAMTLSSLLPLFITALRENGIFFHFSTPMNQNFHGQTAQVSATNFFYTVSTA